MASNSSPAEGLEFSIIQRNPHEAIASFRITQSAGFYVRIIDFHIGHICIHTIPTPAISNSPHSNGSLQL